MSYIRPFETDTLPHLNGHSEANARRLRALEEELAAYRRGSTPRPGLLKFTEYDSSGSSRRMVSELQEQTKLLREEMRRKDALIQQLTSGKDPGRRLYPSDDPISGRGDLSYHGDHLDRGRADVAALQAKYERVSHQLKDCELELETKDIKIRELQTLVDANRDNELRGSEVNRSLHDRIRDLEMQVESHKAAVSQDERTIASLQRELRNASDKILDLEAQRRQHLDMQINKATMATEQRLRSLVSQLASLLNLTEDAYDFSAASTVDTILKRLSDLVQDNALLKGKLLTVEETLSNTQLEGKASRDTIMRLVSEMAREQKVTTRYTTEVDSIRVERENAMKARRELEREVEVLKERLEACQRMLDTTNAELEMRGKHLTSLEQEMRTKSHTMQSSSTQFQLFREQLANLLGTAFQHMEPTEEALKEAIRKLAVNSQEHRLRMDDYEARVRSLTDQLNKQMEIQRELSIRAEKFESKSQQLDDKLRCATGELAAGDVLREGFRSDKEKYLRGLQRLGEVMKMDHISLDLGLDSTLDGLVVRAEQLVRLEGSNNSERSTHIYNLQRKVRSLKEQLESKELHIDLLRKKLTGMEDRVQGRMSLEKDAEADALRVQKLERLVDKYKLQAQDARQELQNVRAQMLGATEMQLRMSEQRRDVEELARQVEELEEVRRKQARKICALREEVASNELQTQEKRLVADNAVEALSSELRTTKNAMDSLKYREKQLMDFRGVIARMLGLDVNTLAVPDYEIISRLEKIIKAQSGMAFTPVGLATDTESEYGPVISELDVTDRVVRKTRERSRERSRHRGGSKGRARARSMSPTKRDPRVY